MQGATETEDKAGMAITELWALILRIMQDHPEVSTIIHEHRGHQVLMREHLWDLVAEIKEGLDMMPAYRMWAGAALDLANGGHVTAEATAKMLETGWPQHLVAIDRLAQRHQADLKTLRVTMPLATSAATWVVALEQHPGLREAISNLIDKHAGLGAEVFGSWQNLRVQAAAFKLLTKVEDD